MDTTTSRRLADRKTAKFQKNITKRGSVPETTVKKGNDYPVGPLVLGFFIFVVIGSYNQDSDKRWDGLKT
uniref:Stress-associated endoplasmic reticulum protein n=1 Tax=Leersia perrieri TaxID=77586 RepID=A0A0D9XUH5_9ORYZ